MTQQEAEKLIEEKLINNHLKSFECGYSEESIQNMYDLIDFLYSNGYKIIKHS